MRSFNFIYLLLLSFFADQQFPRFQIFPGLILSDIKPAKRMKFKTVCYLLVQLMHCRKMFKAEIPFSNVMTCEDDDKVNCFCEDLQRYLCNYYSYRYRTIPGLHCKKNPFDVFVWPFGVRYSVAG